MIYVFTEDAGSGKAIWERIKQTFDWPMDIQSSGGNQQLAKTIENYLKTVTVLPQDTVIAAHDMFDDSHYREVCNTLAVVIQDYGCQAYVGIYGCIESVILSFADFTEWISPYKSKNFTGLLKAREIIINLDPEIESSTIYATPDDTDPAKRPAWDQEISKCNSVLIPFYREHANTKTPDKNPFHSLEAAVAAILAQLTHPFKGEADACNFKIDKGNLGECWYCTCCQMGAREVYTTFPCRDVLKNRVTRMNKDGKVHYSIDGVLGIWKIAALLHKSQFSNSFNKVALKLEAGLPIGDIAVNGCNLADILGIQDIISKLIAYDYPCQNTVFSFDGSRPPEQSPVAPADQQPPEQSPSATQPQEPQPPQSTATVPGGQALSNETLDNMLARKLQAEDALAGMLDGYPSMPKHAVNEWKYLIYTQDNTGNTIYYLSPDLRPLSNQGEVTNTTYFEIENERNLTYKLGELVELANRVPNGWQKHLSEYAVYFKRRVKVVPAPPDQIPPDPDEDQ